MPERRMFHNDHHPVRYRLMFHALLIFGIALCMFGLSMDSPAQIWLGLKRIILNEDALITDYIRMAGPGAAFVNSGLVTLFTVITLKYLNDPFNGFTLVVIGLMAGFSLFGKNLVNSAPILLGCWLYAKYRHEPYVKYVNMGFMSTALSPIVSYTALDNGWGNIALSIVVGMCIGFLLPSLSVYTYRIQNGMNLYNMGFACGLMAMIIVPLMSSFSADPEMNYIWASGYNSIFAPVLWGFCCILILTGLFIHRRPIWAVWAGYRRLLQTSGRSPSDYLRMFGPEPMLINIGVNGLIATSFILCLGGELNGPTIGGIFTIMGFSAFGKHAFNILPVMVGVTLGAMVVGLSPSEGTTQLSILFGTTLAPISGYFGWPYGVLAGLLHSVVVRYTSDPVAGMNLYNNGFSGGLIAIVLYPTIIAIARKRKPQLQNEDYFDLFTHDEPITPPNVHEFVEEEDTPEDE